MVDFRRLVGSGPDYVVSIYKSTGSDAYIFSGTSTVSISDPLAIAACRGDPRLEEVAT